MTAFSSLILDVDSTLAGVEGIDWLARRRGAEVAERVAELTAASMEGSLSLGDVYGSRLGLVMPTMTDIQDLSDHYLGSIAPGAIDVIARLHTAGVRIVLVSGGIRAAILPLAASLRIAAADVHAVDILIGDDGGYRDFDRDSPLVSQDGKLPVVRSLELPRPTLFVGDGSTDLAARPAVDSFAVFTGFIGRPAIVAAADVVVTDFLEIESLVLGQG